MNMKLQLKQFQLYLKYLLVYSFYLFPYVYLINDKTMIKAGLINKRP